MVKIKDGRTVEVGDRVILTKLINGEDQNTLISGHTPTVTITAVIDKAIGGREFGFVPSIEGVSYFSEIVGDRFEFVDEVEQAVDTTPSTDFDRIEDLSNGDIITIYHIYNSHGDLVTLTTPKTVKVKSTDGHYALLENHVSGLIGLGPEDLFTIDVKATKGNGKDKVVYSGGHLLNQAFVEYRDKQHEQLAAIDGIEPYSPHKDKSINDKSNADQTGLAERILANDFKAMQESDVFIFDVLNEGLGTIAEMGIVLGMKHQAQKVVDELKEIELREGYLNDDEDALRDQQFAILNKPVLCYCSDIRQGNGHISDHTDRFEYSTNQFVYGVCLELTNGEGFISWNEVLERLEEIGSRNR